MKKIFIIAIFLTFFTPVVFIGAISHTITVPTSGDNVNTYSPPVQSSGGLTVFKLDNPLNVKSVCGLIKSILQAVLVIGLPIAVLFLVFAGLKYVAALGKPEKINEANKNLLWTVVGIAIFLGAALIAQVVATTVSQVASQSGAGFQTVSSCN